MLEFQDNNWFSQVQIACQSCVKQNDLFDDCEKSNYFERSHLKVSIKTLSFVRVLVLQENHFDLTHSPEATIQFIYVVLDLV